MSEKVDTTYLENRYNEPAPRPGVGQKAKRHCARWWWLHLIIFCVVFLIIALCLVYAAMPHIAQHDVNKSTLTFTELDFLEPTADSVTITQKGILHSYSMYTPTLDPFTASSWLVTNGTFGANPILTVEMPKIHAMHGDNNVSVSSQVASVVDTNQLNAFTIAALNQEYITTALTGKTKLHEGALPVTTVSYNKSTTYKGLNRLAGFNVTSPKINLTATTGTPNFIGFAFIPNPSIMTFAMGNVTLSLATAQAGVLGNATVENMTLVPGNNSLPMTAIIDQLAVLGSMDKSGNVLLQITGTSAVYNGVHLTYYEAALKSNVLSLEMNIAAILTGSA
ncbi:hypothetical protein BP5796_03162 [Coleophoma crateriformis]|uniref:Uncharacterized protein n=1 Tax=Coleophoma crateriformis TaxID=565419 RepID=A0A3D8SNU7_9HELO|nr:hypothetical protein BP5796_03162 [Coleophoma crateriformis]